MLLKWTRFCLEVRDTYKPAAKNSELDMLLKYSKIDYLAIDDFGIGARTDRESVAALRLAFDLLDARYEKTGCTTDISTNWQPDELRQKFDDRIVRRIGEMTTVYVMSRKVRTRG